MWSLSGADGCGACAGSSALGIDWLRAKQIAEAAKKYEEEKKMRMVWYAVGGAVLLGGLLLYMSKR